ncbi:MAG: universal stress protein [Tannerellaceae bacterium]|jgi:nucleotide-binding universal stress UspA family protein|nr:universal stress protein [Tannerellaceae bacterium]
MNDNLVTLAIHTFEKAQILKTILETEGIEVYIHNVNQIQPVISAGVRVRIKESDLPHALRIIEDSKWMEETQEERMAAKQEKKILIPVDFSSYSRKACDLGIHYAHRVGAEVIVMHAYFSPYFPTSIPIGDTLAYQMDESESIKIILKHVKDDMEELSHYLQAKMESGELPQVKYECILREGLPEEEIISFCRVCRPILVVMGTKGKNQRNIDLVGSVTGEIIEINKVPTLAIPEYVPFNNLSEAKHIAFATSFNPRDLIAFDRFMELMQGFHPKIFLFNISTSHEAWDKNRLSGIQEYFSKQYPGANIVYTVLDEGDLLLAVERFVRDNQIDMIALTTHRRNMLARMFNPGIARKMLFHTDTPLLILHA